MTLEPPVVDPMPVAGRDADADARLMGQMIGGSQDALAALYDRHGQAVFLAAMRTTRDRSIAAEVVQETFLILWNRAESFDPTMGTLAGWLRTIARNRAVDHLRTAARHARAATFSSFGGAGGDQNAIDEWLTESGQLIATADAEPGPEAAYSTKETRASIDAALASLGPLERSVITLAYRTGLSQAEIAAELGWPLGTVKTRTRRALRRLRDRLERSPDGAGGQHAGHSRATPGPARASSTAGPDPRPCWPPLVPAGAAPLASPCA